MHVDAAAADKSSRRTISMSCVSATADHTRCCARQCLQQCRRRCGATSSLGARWVADCNQSVASGGESRDDHRSLANVRWDWERSVPVVRSARDDRHGLLITANSRSYIAYIGYSALNGINAVRQLIITALYVTLYSALDDTEKRNTKLLIYGWFLRGTVVVQRRSLTGEPSLVLCSICSWRVTTLWVNRPLYLQVSQPSWLSLSSFGSR